MLPWNGQGPADGLTKVPLGASGSPEPRCTSRTSRSSALMSANQLYQPYQRGQVLNIFYNYLLYPGYSIGGAIYGIKSKTSLVIVSVVS